ncbi:MAG: CBS domain-containing protein [Bacilli bacterium]|nr:CBS domain-containing protein [Bacilli bacterium]MBN2876978.1 CBS domain-containing protein [Bacilli bacterium]
MTKEKEFLEVFNQLEQYLRVEYNGDHFSYSGFMSTLYRIKKTGKNKIINNKYNFDVLKQASQIRNIIAHNNDVLVPSEVFMNKFKEIVDRMTNPLKVENIMIPFSQLKTVQPSNTVGEAIELLKEHGYNTIPVIGDHHLLGIFTEKSVFDYLSMFNNESIAKSMKISDIIEAIDLNYDPRKYFAFISRGTLVETAYEHFDRDRKHRREMLILLVTEHGEKDEKLLGIVTMRDIENALLG